LLLGCLQAHVGVHVLDEEQLAAADVRSGKLCVGRAQYETILLPSATVLAEKSLKRLRWLRGESGMKVHVFGDEPALAETEHSIEPIAPGAFERVTATDWTAWCREHLPRLLPISSTDERDVRVSAWRHDDQTTWLMMNLGSESQSVRIGDGQAIELGAAHLVAMQSDDSRSFRVTRSFETTKVAPDDPPPFELPITNWRTRWPDQPWRWIDRPVAAYQLRPPSDAQVDLLPLPLTGNAFADGTPVAAYLDYAANVRLDSTSPDDLELIFEPTSQRGRLTVTVNGREWTMTLRDIDVKPVRLPIRDVLRAGDNELQVRVHEPMSLDGIKWPPSVTRTSR
jgi:hypothetical protein